MNLAKLIVPDINVCLKVRVTWVWFEWGTFCVSSDAWCGAGTSMLPACLCTANNLVLRLHRALQCGSDAKLCFKMKQDVEHKRGSWNNSSAGSFGGGSCKTRTGQCSVLLRSIVSFAHGPLEVVWVFVLFSCWWMLGKNGTTVSSSNCF